MTIRVTRSKAYYGTLRALKVRLDGQDVGSLKPGESLELRGTGDEQSLRFHMDWMTSRPFAVRDPAPGVDQIEVRMPNPVAGFFRTVIAPRSAISVVRLEG